MSRDDLWDHYSDAWKGPWSLLGFLRLLPLLSASVQGKAYLLFVENVAAVLDGDLESPNGASIPPGDERLRGQPTRYRGSGPTALHFVRRSLDFEDLTSGRIGDLRRERRRRALIRFFRDKPLRSFDLYVPEGDGQSDMIAARLVPTSWNLIVLKQADASTRRLVFHSSTGAAEEDGYESAALRWIVRLPSWLEARLRDIFSLNHVRDARLGRGFTEGGPGGSPPPDRGTDEAATVPAYFERLEGRTSPGEMI